jgi:hypothetical protein
MSELARLALLEIIKHAESAESQFVAMCVKRKIQDMSTRGSLANDVFASITGIKRWAEAIKEEPPA